MQKGLNNFCPLNFQPGCTSTKRKSELHFFEIQVKVQVFLNGSETSETLLQAELYVAKLSLKCRYLFGNFCKFLAPKTKTVNKNIVMKVNFLKKLSI